MKVFVSRVRRAYARKRSVKEMALCTVLLLVVAAALGFAGARDEQDREIMLSDFSQVHRTRVVSSWGGQAAGASLDSQQRGDR